MKKRTKKNKQNWPLHLRPLWPERCALNHPRATGLIDLRTMTTRPTTSTNTARWRTTPTRPRALAHTHTQRTPSTRHRRPSQGHAQDTRQFWSNVTPSTKERLGDEDQGVLTATVNTFLELSRKNAKNYLSLVPQLYHILTNTTNNWLSIKLLKVFQLLCPLEPRLPAKMVEPLTNFLNTTKALSVEFESIRCTVRVMPEGTALMAIDMEKLQNFLNSSDRLLICTEKSWIKLSSKTSLLCRTCRRRCSRACRNAG